MARYLAEGNPPDQSGSFIEWLRSREPVYGYSFAGIWLDIGDKEQLLAADNMLRRAQGLARAGRVRARDLGNRREGVTHL